MHEQKDFGTKKYGRQEKNGPTTIEKKTRMVKSQRYKKNLID